MKIADSEKSWKTHLQGRFIMPYDILVFALGLPHWTYEESEQIEDKVDVSWCFEFDDGDIVTVYNWKDGIAYNGRHGLDVEDMKDWHIGGHDNSVVYRLTEYINNKIDGMNDNGE